MDPGTIAGITFGTLAGAIILGNAGRNIHIRRERKTRFDKVRRVVTASSTRGNRGLWKEDSRVTVVNRFADPTARGRKKTRRQYKKK
jgi:hypothetical protein